MEEIIGFGVFITKKSTKEVQKLYEEYLAYNRDYKDEVAIDEEKLKENKDR